MDAYLEGCAVPELRGLTVPRATVKYADPFNEFSLQYEFRNGDFKANISIERTVEDDFHSLIVHSIDLLQSVADTYAFANGVSLQIVLKLFVAPESTTGRLILLGHRPLVQYFNTTPDDDRIDTIQKLAWENREFAFALRDLNQALNTQNYSALAAGRAVEVIRNTFLEGGENESKGWSNLREKLRVTQNFLMFVTNHSKGARHGRRIGINGDEQHQTLARAWIIIDRYVDFKTSGILDPAQYPILDQLPEPSRVTRKAIGLRTA